MAAAWYNLAAVSISTVDSAAWALTAIDNNDNRAKRIMLELRVTACRRRLYTHDPGKLAIRGLRWASLGVRLFRWRSCSLWDVRHIRARIRLRRLQKPCSIR